jgi:hypothetical protein
MQNTQKTRTFVQWAARSRASINFFGAAQASTRTSYSMVIVVRDRFLRYLQHGEHACDMVWRVRARVVAYPVST